MTDAEMEAASRAKIAQASAWEANLERLFAIFAGWRTANAAQATEDDLMRLWGKESGPFGKTGLPPVARPSDPQRWQTLRDMTATLIDPSRPIGERLVAALRLGRRSFKRGELPFPAVMRAAMILAGGRYGTVVTLNSGNELLGALGAPAMRSDDDASLTAGWKRFAELIDQWSPRVGAQDAGQRAQIPWHYLDIVRAERGAGSETDDEAGVPDDSTRADGDDVADVFERVMPDPKQRKQCLELLADSIERANALHPSSWSLALIRQGNAISLNVGVFIAIRVRNWATLATIITEGLSEEEKESLRPLLDTADSFTDMAGSAVLDVPHPDFEKLLPRFRQAHLEFVDRAAGRVKLRTPKYRNHSRELLAQLSAAVGRELPQPKYLVDAPATLAAESPAALPAAAAVVFDVLDRTRNVILHGPPGTGKTHAVRALREALLADQLSATGREWIVTAPSSRSTSRSVTRNLSRGSSRSLIPPGRCGTTSSTGRSSARARRRPPIRIVTTSSSSTRSTVPTSPRSLEN